MARLTTNERLGWIVRDLRAQLRRVQTTLDELMTETDDKMVELRGEREGRPDFILKATDRLAPRIFAEWIALAAKHEQFPLEKLGRARKHLAAIVEWQKNNPDKVKWPD